MENLKLISVRVDPCDLDALDKIVNGERYVKRSDLIQAAIKLYLAAHEKGLGEKVQRFLPQWGDVVDEFKFEYHRGPRYV